MKTISLIFQCIIAIEILIFIGVSPVLFTNLSFNLKNYLQTVYQVSIRLFTFRSFAVDAKISLFPFIFDRYLDSMRILGLGIIVACAIALIFAYALLHPGLLFDLPFYFLLRYPHLPIPPLLLFELRSMQLPRLYH